METASPQDRLDAIQSRLTTIGGLAAELAAQASQALDAQAQVAESIESSYRQDLEQLRTAAEAVLHAVESLGPQQELFLTPALEGVAGALRALAAALREMDGSA